jgi:hypothetical protein
VSSARTAKPSIAARSNGGTSNAAVTGVASTRPSAAASGTRSVRAIGAAASRIIASASSSEMVPVIGRIVFFIA